MHALHEVKSLLPFSGLMDIHKKFGEGKIPINQACLLCRITKLYDFSSELHGI